MYDNIERELKLLINEKVYNELLHSYDFHNPITQTNTYFDTNNQDVKKQRGAVRIRTIQDKKILWFNYIFANLLNVFWLITIVLTIAGVITLV